MQAVADGHINEAEFASDRYARFGSISGQRE